MINKSPDPIIIPIDGEPSEARAYVAVYGDYITEKEFNDAMDRYFEEIAKSMDEYIGGAILG